MANDDEQEERPEVTDPMTCPECQGRRGVRLGEPFLACTFCGGLGQVGGGGEPAERGEEPPPDGPPPAWEHRVWSDPWIAETLGCRFCLGSKKLAHIEAGTLVSVPCRCAGD
ncbi:hypothetical protein [Nonomuraea sp. NPDC052265]|uniref:hypothetical protein n=1 Tax=Nonomuraea sp. NPDC052265 TaxID=3364374 RepID=UPI0037CA1F65